MNAQVKQNARTSTVEALRLAHEALLADLRKLEAATTAPQPAKQWELATRLVETETHLREHFRFEEQNGYMDVVRKREPRLEHAIQQLAGAHRELAQTLQALVKKARVAQPLDDLLRGKVREWIAQVRQHETSENELVQDAFNVDLSAED